MTGVPERPILQLDDVHAYYGLAHVLHGVSLSVARGELVALLGRNGAGKTTTLRSIMSLVDVRGGSVRIDDIDLVDHVTEDVARLGVGYVPEDRRMFPGLTVAENLRIAALGAQLDPEQARASLDRIWEIFPSLEAFAERDAAKLSGGQQQMVAIGRGLITGARLLLVDEPSQGLAPIIVVEIAARLRQIARDGIGVLLVEQNSVMALELADRAYVLDQGAVAASASAAQIDAQPDLLHEHLVL